MEGEVLRVRAARSTSTKAQKERLLEDAAEVSHTPKYALIQRRTYCVPSQDTTKVFEQIKERNSW
eukprot:2600839-Amphidinium_carterae.2